MTCKLRRINTDSHFELKQSLFRYQIRITALYECMFLSSFDCFIPFLLRVGIFRVLLRVFVYEMIFHSRLGQEKPRLNFLFGNNYCSICPCIWFSIAPKSHVTKWTFRQCPAAFEIKRNSLIGFELVCIGQVSFHEMLLKHKKPNTSQHLV